MYRALTWSYEEPLVRTCSYPGRLNHFLYFCMRPSYVFVHSGGGGGGSMAGRRRFLEYFGDVRSSASLPVRVKINGCQRCTVYFNIYATWYLILIQWHRYPGTWYQVPGNANVTNKKMYLSIMCSQLSYVLHIR